MRTVTANLNVKITMKVDEGVEISHILDEIDYDFIDTTTRATIEDTEITDYEIEDSR